MKNKKLLIFTEYFLPGYKAGGPIRSIYNLAKILSKKYDVYVVAKDRDIGENKPYDDIQTDKVLDYEEFHIYYISDITKSAIHNIISDINPDTIYINSFFSKTSQIILYLNKFNLIQKKLVLAPRGELQPNALQIKSFKKKVYMLFTKMTNFYDGVVFHSTDKTETINIKKQIKTDNIFEISNISMPTQVYTPLIKDKDQLHIIFLSRIRDNKNLIFALDVIKDFNFDITFGIYGPIEDEDYWKRCQKIIEVLPQNIKCKYYGSVKPENIASTMRKYHCLLLPTMTENFGHVIAEAMFAGVIPIISDQTPWLSLEEKQAGWDISLNNKNEYEKVVEKLYKMEEDNYQKLSKSTMLYVKKKLNLEKIKNAYIKLFK
jgi:glycosyltransferase involved in cell wall biosynthesis